ncbi:MAG: UDP-2,3-diacylglucosamine diphosphatase LpxI, partial [Hyphomicrobium sp.]
SGSPRGVLIKRPKPGQELRIDLPAIGPDTVTRAAEAGLKGIAVLAGRTITAQRPELVRRADALRLFVEGIAEPTAAAALPKVPALPHQIALAVVAGAKPSPDTAVSAIKGVRVVSALSRYGVGQAAVVVRRHVLAVEAGEGSLALLERVAALRQWGESKRKRRGVAVLRDGAETGVRAIEAADRAGLEGVVIVATGQQSISLGGEATGTATRLGLFLATAIVEELETTDD